MSASTSINHESAANSPSPSMESSSNQPPVPSQPGGHYPAAMITADDLDIPIANVEVEAKKTQFSLRSEIRSTQSSTEELPDDSNRNVTPIHQNLIKLLVNGSKGEILALAQTVQLCDLQSDEDGNHALHIVATNSSQAELIADILPISKDMIKRKNSKGDLAFHSAAKAGRLDALRALTAWRNYPSSSVEEGIKPELLAMGNNAGDTPLHIALENNQQEMAEYLMGQHGEACYKLNKKLVSPLYLAVKAGYWDLAKQMIVTTEKSKPDSEDALFRGKSVVHAAIEAHNSEILKEILGNHEKLIESYDDKKRTPLSCAALKGDLEGVQYLLETFTDCAYKRDKDEEGSFPIHKAASGGHIKVIKVLHSTKHLRNKKGQSVLHVASRSGKSEVVSYLLQMQELESLINLKDEDGNTPLHLATLGFHPRVVYILTRERRVKPELKNMDGLTALDVLEIHGSNPKFEARLTWMALRYIDAPRSSQSTRKSYVEKKREEQQKYHSTGQRRQTKEPNDKQQLESYKDRIDTYLLVATLVATVMFAAGVTLPGGYRQDDPQMGMAVLPHRWAFEVFVICNTAAMYSSILAVVMLAWAHLGDLKLVLLSLKFALPVLGVALAMMSLAFMMGVHVVLRNQPWLSCLVLGIGSIFLAVVLVFFIPLYNPSYIRNSVVRFLFSGSFLWLLIVCEKSKIEYA